MTEEGVLSERNGLEESGQVSPNGPKGPSPELPKFTLGKRGILAFFTLSVLTLMVALDGTSISVALPVRVSTTLDAHTEREH
jgi:hypothetical protein